MNEPGTSRTPPPLVPNSAAIKRLTVDYRNLIADPLPSIIAHPSPSDIFQWHFVIAGSTGTCYEGGYYHGRIDFPIDFPFRPPNIRMFTPSGRFETNTHICLSITAFHPENWNPCWTVSSILMAFLSFMNDTDYNHSGGMTKTDDEKRTLAEKSVEFNLQNPLFCEFFPDLIPLMQAGDDALLADEE